MFDRLLTFLGLIDGREDYHVQSAKRFQKIAEEDHEEAVELIKLLEIEHKKNNYARLVESALGARRRN